MTDDMSEAARLINAAVAANLAGWCLICGALGTHKFAALMGPDGWLCEEHKDDPVDEYGNQARR